MLYRLEIQTHKRDEMIDITERVRERVKEAGIEQGIAIIYSPHTTAGIAINENADPDVQHDVLMRLDEVFPWNHAKYRHMEGNSASHLKAITTGTSQTVIIENHELVLGRWQGIYFCEFDGPRMRTCLIKLLRG
mgnify:CR=1 FL=1|jgi:secondary thiamine-phosphate synthase enzyme